MYFCQKSSKSNNLGSTSKNANNIKILVCNFIINYKKVDIFFFANFLYIDFSSSAFVSSRSIQLKLCDFSLVPSTIAFLLSAESKSKHLLGFSEKNFLIRKLEIREPSAVHKRILTMANLPMKEYSTAHTKSRRTKTAKMHSLMAKENFFPIQIENWFPKFPRLHQRKEMITHNLSRKKTVALSTPIPMSH